MGLIFINLANYDHILAQSYSEEITGWSIAKRNFT